MRIPEIYRKKKEEGKPVFSLEVFPPKTSDKFENTYAAAESIARLNRAYISVTYGAGGGRGAFTAELAQRIHQQNQHYQKHWSEEGEYDRYVQQ